MSSITVKILAFWLFYIPVAFSTEIGDVFNVKQGSENGGCDSHLSVLTRWWTESQAMASAGISAFDDAKGNADDTKTKNAKHALQKYLGINDDTDDEDVDDIKCKTSGHLLLPFGHLQAKCFITLPERYHLPDFGLQ
jgi:hypothetical protein